MERATFQFLEDKAWTGRGYAKGPVDNYKIIFVQKFE